MRVVCAWCGAVRNEGRGPVSHGICQACAAIFEQAYWRAMAARAGRRRRRIALARAGAPLPGFELELQREPRAVDVTSAGVG